MESQENQHYVKRTQKDYSMSFKLQVVQEVERGELSIKGALRKYGIQSHSTVLGWIRKFGIFDREFQISKPMKKTPEQRIFELEQEVKKLKKQKSSLEQQLNLQDQKAIMFDTIVDIVREDYNIDLRKKVFPEQSNTICDKEDEA